MKKGNGVKAILIISIVILLSLISFVGIYMKETNQYKDIVPNYNLGMDLGQRRVVSLKVKSGTTTIIRDEEGKKVSSIPEDEDESKYTKEEVKINAEDLLTEKNYKKAKKVIEERLNRISSDGYEIKYSKSTGNIVVELPENDNTSNVVNTLTATGKFELISEDTEEVLLSNNDLKKATISYYSGQADEDGHQSTTVYLTIKLDKEGTKKLKEISNTYVKSDAEKSNEATDNSITNTTVDKFLNGAIDSTTTNETTNTTTNIAIDETTADTTNETEEKKVILRLDWPNSYTGNLAYNDVITQSFESEITDGTFQLRIGTATTNEALQDYYNQARQICAVLNSGVNEIQYEVDTNKILGSEISQNQITVTIITLIVIFAIISLAIIVAYKGLGLLGTIANISMIACTLIFVRLTTVPITINLLPTIISIVIANTFIIVKLISKVKNSESARTGIWRVILESIDLLVVLLVIAIVFTFMSGEAIISAGMIMFWGIISMVLTNLLFTKPLLLAVKSK